LIGSYWGGTRIEAWSRPVALEACSIEPNTDEAAPQNTNSALWNGMIAPFTRLALFGFLWYQGEANTGWNRDQYNCTFSTMIQDWRTAFRVPMAPFGFVQLSTIKYGNTGLYYPQLRWHQTADLGSVPNNVLENVYMSVAVDTYDEPNGIHPWYKQIVADRLAVAGLRVAYGLTNYPAEGPVVKSVVRSPDSLVLTFDQPITLNTAELSGFYYCCEQDSACFAASNQASWPEVAKEAVTASGDDSVALALSGLLLCPGGATTTPSLAYLWRETPIATPTWGAPIYAADEFRLPAAPWIWYSADLS
jgi:sialate O-acetylesterase